MTAFLDANFFTASPASCAAAVIGMEFRWNGCGGIIVETEAYAAEGDPACHTFFRKGARAFVSEHPPGTAYIYLNYGIHWLFNVLVKGSDGDGFVLLRALQPTLGLSRMVERRGDFPSRFFVRARRGSPKLWQSMGPAMGAPF